MNIFGSKKREEKKEVKIVNLNETSDRIGNNMNDIKSKLESIDKELKISLEAYRNAKNPTIKNQAKLKATNILKKKKLYESHLYNLSNTQFNVDNANITSEMIKNNVDIV
jgi:hypothetical protein